ncbi:hypothetical protein HJG54_03865 [Leptolyngbya sp. NK1-12]|uniref:Uncharacterized protein n=1 Tax=Leptolyngbya sp. NK1-12 TaxID=2547451 RepID=A0AA96WBJ8_9CYAN|nr:hypothetical protein [Leptolyngbya sp. NK1-12]WNZ22089.1 hypothetical protein HJG54_03865 [Leptolyngbya sp. NK1-12]
MSIQRFPLAAVQQVRQYIQNAIVVDADKQVQTWTGIDDIDDIPEPKSLDDLSSVFAFGGLTPEEITAPQSLRRWSVSMVNPGAALLKLPGLDLKPTWRLVSYLYRDGDNGAGLVLAVPEELATTAHLEKALPASGNFKQPPKPEGALMDFMEAIDGDRSAVSFLVASLLCRELREFGALGAYRNWTHHRPIDAIPQRAKWHWQTEPPKDLAPKVKVLPDGQAVVEFFTCRISAGIALYRHLDQYPVNQYKPKCIDKALATPQR